MSVTAVRLPGDLTTRLDAWAARNGLSRSDAIRDMIETRLAQQPSGKPHKGAVMAKDMAKAVLNDRLKDLPDEERITRKQRLLKGPTG
jgi:metal-responsive CopG/Arc/MetJ family transcriptional regulator